MSRLGKGKKAVSLPKKKDAAIAACKAMNKEAEDSNTMMARLEEDDKRRYYARHNSTVSNKMKSMINKLMGKDKPKKKRKTRPCPILGAVLKYHNDDNTDDYMDDDDNVDPAIDAVSAA